MAESGPRSEARTAESIIRDLERLRVSPCVRCGKQICSHQLLLSMAIGFKDTPRCLPCLGEALDYDPAQIRDSLWEFILNRECYLGAWNWASRSAGVPENQIPESLLAMESRPAVKRALEMAAPALPGVKILVAAEWDAGEMGCGDLVLELRMRLHNLRPGEVLHLRAQDPGAPEDLPAWCRLTGHTLLRADSPFYWIKRKD